MIANPGETAVTNPVSDTIATLLLEELQVTLGVVALSGVTVAFNCNVPPT